MGQTLWCYDCCWYSHCYFVGCSYSFFCCNCWVCQPAYMQMIRPQQCCLADGCKYGCGSTSLISGCYWCPPDFLINYSVRDTIGNKQATLQLGDMQLVGGQPTGLLTQPMMGNPGQVQMMQGQQMQAQGNMSGQPMQGQVYMSGQGSPGPRM